MAGRGTSVEQDPRFGYSDKRLLDKMMREGKFASSLEKKYDKPQVDFKKVNLDIMSKWVTEKVTDLLGFEDEIVINLIINNIHGEKVDPKRLQMELTGFLEKDTRSFMEELWDLLLDAQNQPSGIPSVFIAKKKEELIAREEQRNRRTVDRNTDTMPAQRENRRDRGSDVERETHRSASRDRHRRRSRSRDRRPRHRSRERDHRDRSLSKERRRRREERRRQLSPSPDSRKDEKRRRRDRSEERHRRSRYDDNKRNRSSSSSSSNGSSRSSSSDRR